jgi:hypothetical protein
VLALFARASQAPPDYNQILRGLGQVAQEERRTFPKLGKLGPPSSPPADG